MKRLLLPFCILFISQSILAQDTTWIQTLDFSDITKRRDWYVFPDGADDYRKILMYYTLKCDAATTQDGYACGEWDYLTYSFVYDHTGVLDSNQQNHPHFLYGGDNLDSLWYTSAAQFNTIESYEYFPVIDVVNSESGFTIGGVMGSNTQPLGGYSKSRSQFIWTASELNTAGLLAGDIQRLAIQITDYQTDLGRLTISMKNSSTLIPIGFEGGGTVVYDQTTAFPNGANVYNLDLLTPFTWNGTSSILVEFSYEMEESPSLNQTSFFTTDDTSGVYATGVDNAIVFEDSKYMEIPLGGTDFGDEITVSFWAYGNPDIQPADSYSFEAVNSSDQRVLNVHLPWSNQNVYWDAGEGSSYDRINKAATVAEYEGNWVHWAFTKNAATGSMKIYKNGSLWHSGTGLTRTIGEIDRFVVGKGFAGANSHNGKMDEFQVWNVELDANTIASWMNKRIDVSHPNYTDLIAYYNFDQADYQLTDNSGNGNTPILVGAPSVEAKTEGYGLDATLTSDRPLLTFIQGDYATHLDSSLTTIVVPQTPTTISEFEVVANGIQPIGNTNVYAGYSYTYHADGTADSTLIAVDAVSYNDTLWFYQEPFEVVDRYEIARYITPYGINLSLGPQGFTWVYDVTDYAHLLLDSVDIENGNQQELIDVKFAMIKGTPMAEVVEFTRPWGQSASLSYGNLDNDVSLPPIDVAVHPNAEHFKMKTRLTGHGHNTSNANGAYPHCCEWKDNTHYLKVNGNQAASWHIWQTHECAQNPVFPQGGTWPGAREGWCPGDVVKDNEFIVTNLVSGSSVNLDYDITPVPANNPGMAGGNYVTAMHFLQYGAANHSLDAEVYEVLSPTNWEYRSRTNPYCDDARILIRNAGETTLTSLTITYKVSGGQPSTFNWTGNLKFMETEEVELPIDEGTFWQGDNTWKFIATVSEPNGGTDQYAGNDTYTTNFEMPEVYEGNLIVRYKTNNFPQENYWEIRDINGDVAASRNSSDANTLYEDTMNLEPGCYTFYLYDSEDDGLSYWAWPDQGTGYCRLKQNGGGYYETFKPEFGGMITHGFSVGVLASVFDNEEKERLIEVYPNPNQGAFKLEMAGLSGEYTIAVINSLGQTLIQKTVDINSFYEEQFDMKHADNGLYFVRIIGDDLNTTKRVVVNR
ncbi:MAG: T9SS type A sorting domain-containing protein [Flavobacteriales bacterium]|nr:T9SS type A sorting domain-containing protein [Flavobacteriales bacterium]